MHVWANYQIAPSFHKKDYYFSSEKYFAELYDLDAPKIPQILKLGEQEGSKNTTYPVAEVVKL